MRNQRYWPKSGRLEIPDYEIRLLRPFLLLSFGCWQDVVVRPVRHGQPLARAVDVDRIGADFIFVSHGHYDHTTDVARIARRTGAKVLGNWELFDWFKKCGLENAHPINPGGQFTFDFGTVKSFAAQHSSSLPAGTYGGVACGFAFQTPDGAFYYSGDTALSMDMQLVREWTTLDFAVLPIGDGLTMGATDAIKAARLVGVNKVVGVHYDTFDFIKIDHRAAVKSFDEAGMRLHLLDIGSVIDI